MACSQILITLLREVYCIVVCIWGKMYARYTRHELDLSIWWNSAAETNLSLNTSQVYIFQIQTVLTHKTITNMKSWNGWFPGQCWWPDLHQHHCYLKPWRRSKQSSSFLLTGELQLLWWSELIKEQQERKGCGDTFMKHQYTQIQS